MVMHVSYTDPIYRCNRLIHSVPPMATQTAVFAAERLTMIQFTCAECTTAFWISQR